MFCSVLGWDQPVSRVEPAGVRAFGFQLAAICHHTLVAVSQPAVEATSKSFEKLAGH